MRLFIFAVCSSIASIFLPLESISKDYHFHPRMGNDRNDGLTAASPFRSLSALSGLSLSPGDRILLAAGEVFNESLSLVNVFGTQQHPIIVDLYPERRSATLEPAVINAAGLTNGILLQHVRYVTVRNLKVIADGPAEGAGMADMRTGIMVQCSGSERVAFITLENLRVEDVFYEAKGFVRDAGEIRTANGTQRYGWGIRLIAKDPGSLIEEIDIRRCRIRNVEHTGIKLTGANTQNIRHVRITDNVLSHTGGPGVQMSNVRMVHVSGNDIDHSGSNDDARKWGRGSGIWTWGASSVLIEKNRLTNANGPGDSAGGHIDFNCDNIVFQYNFSAGNAGGFCEILGNNYNCAYRYNISVNDGHRIKGANGAFQEGKIFWLSGYQGNSQPKRGPVNSYVYNNTIYARKGLLAKMSVEANASGILLVNNVFHLMGGSKRVEEDQKKYKDSSSVVPDRVVFLNNLFFSKDAWPANIAIQDSDPLYGDAGFKNPGGMSPLDYIPTNKDLMRKGMPVAALPGDAFTLPGGLRMSHDILGMPIEGRPSMGAIQVR